MGNSSRRRLDVVLVLVRANSNLRREAAASCWMLALPAVEGSGGGLKDRGERRERRQRAGAFLFGSLIRSFFARRRRAGGGTTGEDFAGCHVTDFQFPGRDGRPALSGEVRASGPGTAGLIVTASKV
ncbi:hypothetical protein KM043_005959 [Ampulex compressa]|nr:hypothetical protein KM043_005959 [Ampulex compressa]